MIAMQVPKHWLQLDHALAVQRHIHAEHAMGRGMVRPHRDFEQLALAFGLKHGRTVPVQGTRGSGRNGFHWPAPAPCSAAVFTLCSLVRASTSSCGVGSYSKSSGSL